MTYTAESFYKRNAESLEGISTDELLSLISLKAEQVISLDGLRSRLDDAEKLKVKFGTDPTGPDLHLGHIVPIRILDLFRRAGHNIDLIFGDFTAKVGDPTDRNEARKVLTDDEIYKNMSTFQDQVDIYFDTHAENVEVHRNSLWLGDMALRDVFGYLQAINLTEATQRKDFRTRLEKGQTVTLAETMYGTLMGIDSAELQSDVEIGGIDQLLNFQQTRAIQRSVGQNPEEIIMTPIIEGTAGDGRKMSKSYGNYVPARIDVNEMFGKMMSIPDTLIIPYMQAFLPVYASELESISQQVKEDPFESKKQLATFMSAIVAGDFSKGLEARQEFERRFSDKKITEEDSQALSRGSDTESLMDLLKSSGDFQSNSELRRLAEQGGIRVDGSPVAVDVLLEPPEEGAIVAVGKRKLYRVE